MFFTIQEAAIWDNRLRELRKEHKLTLTQLIEKMGTYMTTYVRYEPGKRMLPVDIDVRIAAFYGASVDYLLGLTDVREPYPPSKRISR